MDDSINQAGSHRHDNNASHTQKERAPIGMDSFDADAQEAFGHELRIFMAFKDGSAIAPESDHPQNALPDEASAIARRLKQLGQDISSGMADQLELLVRYDDLEGWKAVRFPPLCGLDEPGIGHQPAAGLGVLAGRSQTAILAHHACLVQSRKTHLVDHTAALTRGRQEQ